MAKGKPFSRVVTVEAHSKSGFGIQAAGTWYNFSKDSGLTAKDAPKGQSFTISGTESMGTGQYAGKPSFFIDAITPLSPGAGAAPSAAPNASPAPFTPPATKAAPGAAYQDRDASIVTQAMMKSLIESPSVALLMGGAKSLSDVVEEEARKMLAVHDKLVGERTK